MKRTIISAMVMALIFGLSSLVFAEGYTDFMTTAKNSLKAKMYGDALSYAQKALEARQNGDAEAFALIGDIYFEQGVYGQAEKNWRNALTFKIKNPTKFKANAAAKFFALGRSNLGNIQTAREFFNYATSFGYSSAEIAKTMKGYGENIIRQAKTREQGLKAVPYVGQDRVDAVFPEPRWETVFSRTYPGQGPEKGGSIEEANFIKTAQSGKDYTLGDRIVISGQSFFVHLGKWKECKERFEIINQSPNNGKFLYIAAEEGVEVKVEVQRLVQPPKRDDLVTLTEFSAK